MRKKHYRPAKNVVWEEVAGEMIIFKLDNGEYFRLNNTGLVVWEGIVNGLRNDKILRNLRDKFGGSPAQISRDFAEFVENLLTEGLVDEDVYL